MIMKIHESIIPLIPKNTHFRKLGRDTLLIISLKPHKQYLIHRAGRKYNVFSHARLIYSSSQLKSAILFVFALIRNSQSRS